MVFWSNGQLAISNEQNDFFVTKQPTCNCMILQDSRLYNCFALFFYLFLPCSQIKKIWPRFSLTVQTLSFLTKLGLNTEKSTSTLNCQPLFLEESLCCKSHTLQKSWEIPQEPSFYTISNVRSCSITEIYFFVDSKNK